MSDVLQNLRESIADAAAYGTCAVVPLPELRWAADELDRLRAENEALRRSCDDWEAEMKIYLETDTAEKQAFKDATLSVLREIDDGMAIGRFLRIDNMARELSQ